MKLVEGGICAAKGFTANGLHCGIRKNKSKKDLALIVSEKPCSAGAVYTTNLVKGAPLLVTRANLQDFRAQAIICNSGKANTCNANGEEIARGMCELVEKHTGISADDVVVASTGVIGQPMELDPIANAMEALVAGLGDKSDDAAAAIMTTDTAKKKCAVEFELAGKTCRIGGIAKGSGMINPNMATMLVFVTSDVDIDGALLQKAVSNDVGSSFNMITVDGDTSTNDMLTVLANGMAGNPRIIAEDDDYKTFCAMLNVVTVSLSRMIAKDGEGATKLVECVVSGAASVEQARTAAKSVVGSNLLKAAMFGADANWGRVLCAIGYSGIQTDVTKIAVTFCSAAGELPVCKNGAGVDFDEGVAKKVLSESEIRIMVDLGSGTATATAFGCDLTYDYVKINGDYRT